MSNIEPLKIFVKFIPANTTKVSVFLFYDTLINHSYNKHIICINRSGL